MDKKRVLFLDETALRVSEAATSTLTLPGDDGFVVVEDNSSYAARYDMIACCNGEQVLPPMVFTPQDRARRGVQGITKAMLVEYIQQILAQAIGALDAYPLVLVMDKAAIHKTDLLQEFHDMGCQDLKEVVLMPTQAAKRMSPLDNALFHDWKEAVRKHAPLSKHNIVRIMANEWNRIAASKIEAHYKHCLLMPRSDVYADCPDPSSHPH